MKYFIAISSLFILLFFLMGCETSTSSSSSAAASTSAIPWNKPASWEGAGTLGAMGFQGSH